MALRGIRVLELAGLAPVPLVGQILADFGADVLRVNRPRSDFPDPLARGKRSIIVDTATPAGKQLLHRLLEEPSPGFDVLLDPYRPGVLERLLAPQATTSHGGSVHRTPSGLLDVLPPRLIVARVSGYGHDPSNAYHAAAGHDINYAAMSGVLSMLRTAELAACPGRGGVGEDGVSRSGDGDTRDCGRGEAALSAYSRPLPPSNLLADFAGGSLTAVNGAWHCRFPSLQ
jgi:alpha-methylacyl-CoA racemase